MSSDILIVPDIVAAASCCSGNLGQSAAGIRVLLSAGNRRVCRVWWASSSNKRLVSLISSKIFAFSSGSHATRFVKVCADGWSGPNPFPMFRLKLCSQHAVGRGPTQLSGSYICSLQCKAKNNGTKANFSPWFIKPMPWRYMEGRCRYSSTHSLPKHKAVVSGQLHAPAILSSVKHPR